MQSVLSTEGYTQVVNEMHADDQLGKQEAIYGEANYHIVLYGEPSVDAAVRRPPPRHPRLARRRRIERLPPLQRDPTDKLRARRQNHQAARRRRRCDLRPVQLLDRRPADESDAAGTVPGSGGGSGHRHRLPETEGLPYTALDTKQQAAAKEVIKDWVADAAPELADPLLEQYYSQLDQTTIGWAGSTDVTSGDAYLRIDGPRVWIEWLNTSAAGGLHYHTLYRDKALDYGTGLG